MTVPKHIRVVWRGHFDETEEIWSMSAKFSSTLEGLPDADYGDIDVDGMATDFTTFLAGPHIGAHVVADDVRAYLIGTDGLMTGNGPKKHEYTPNTVKGQGSAWQYPSQVALVVTSVGPERGSGRFGRIFLPGPTRNLGTDGRLATANADDYLARVVTWMKATSDRIDLEAAFSSSGVNISPGPAGSTTGTAQNIDHYEMGRVYDTLRTRRNQMIEDRRVGGHIDW